MKVSIKEISAEEEEEVIIRCHEIDEDMLNLVQKLKAQQSSLTGISGEEIHRLHFHEIYYFEVVDNKSFFYCENKVYESKLKLYEFEELCAGTRFFRASKSVVLNSDKIDFIRPSLSGRFEVVLGNQETVMVSRQYVNDLKKLLGM
ncbi:LytTR family transcriptional regulator [Kineothrix alysoides]|uniref:LytTR family transcriptional regulator n=1 Tax=Kineothrix alysoides TaxID=1469948 RepID=A0A4R1R180_9FIRM|nr:LytTR family DNA-binding domain-containing protein [Kineothrix alysoides]TCL59048.1 LytTR family transcriptional regulator [Kineothrix alysoides]